MPTIADIAVGNENFNILVNALTFVDAELPGTNLINTLSDPASDLTVFAPSDAAFAQLAADLGYAGDPLDETAVTTFLAENAGAETIRDIILYHVSPGAQTAADIAANGTVATLFGPTITADLPTLVDQDPDVIDPSLVATDIMADNGIVHVIDRVLLPVDLPGNDAPTITEIVAASGNEFDDNPADFDILLKAVQTAGLADTLNDPNVDLTVFAPTDAAFVGLAQTLGFTGEDEADAWGYLVEALTLLGGGDPVPLLTEILTYHVAGESLQASQVLSAEAITTLQGGELGVDGTSLVDADPDVADPNLIATDIQAANGVVHVLDGVLLPADLLPSDGSNDVDFVIGTDGRDFITTGADNDLISGGRKGDFIASGSGDDLVLAGAGRDIVHAGRGDDTIDGGKGRDLILGNAGDDVINGGAGRDKIFGGSGADTFVFEQGGGRDRIFDFRDGEDVIDLTSFGFSGFDDLEHAIRGNSHRTVINLGDHDRIVLVGVDEHKIDESDFIF